MDEELLKEQTKLDIEGSNKRFILAHLTLLIPLVIYAAIGGVIFLLIKKFGMPALPYTSGNGVLYIFEYIMIAAVAYIVYTLFINGPIALLSFGLSVKFPLRLSYRGGSTLKPLFYGGTFTGYRMMKILLCPILIGFLTFTPFVLFSIVGFVAPILGLPAIIFTVLQIVAVIFAIILSLKFAMVPFYIADDDDSTLRRIKTLKASWQTMTVGNIITYIKINLIHWLKGLACAVPAILGILFLMVVVFQIPAVSNILGLEFIASLPVELPFTLPSLVPSWIGLLPDMSSQLSWLVPTAGAVAGVTVLLSYILYIIFVKLEKQTLNANFYNDIKRELDIEPSKK
ncbi:MAG: hypothetical protein LBT20_01925 [Clostridiales bacterium]|jgi:hypothetical protein|nr:hypothetical protein [Clostridiales bacterium]